MQKYSEFRPSGFDCKGLGLDDRQDWLVAPVSANRDADCLTRSNWEVVTAELAACSEATSAGEPDFEEHEFGHWACGWFRIALVRPGSKAAEIALTWESALADYPVACENHFSDLEHTETCEYWASMSLRERVRLCQDARENVFAARRDSPPERVYDRLREQG